MSSDFEQAKSRVCQSEGAYVTMRPLVSSWEQRKFADFVSASGIRNSENLELPSYSVTNDCGFVPQDERFENGGTMREADKTSYWIVEPKSFAYNPARINVGSIGYQSTSGNVIVSSLYEVFQTDETCDDRFLWHWFKTRLFTQQIEMLQEGGVRLYFFFDKLLKSGISMPSVDEQRLIGEQFDWLDSLITLHQRMCSIFCFCAFGLRTNFNQSSKDSFGYYATSVPCRRCARCHRRWLQAPLASPRRLRFRFFLRWRFDRLASARKNSIISLMRCRSGSLSSPLRGSVACVSRVLDSGGGARLPCRISGAVGLRANHEEWSRARKSRRQT